MESKAVEQSCPLCQVPLNPSTQVEWSDGKQKSKTHSDCRTMFEEAEKALMFTVTTLFKKKPNQDIHIKEARRRAIKCLFKALKGKPIVYSIINQKTIRSTVTSILNSQGHDEVMEYYRRMKAEKFQITENVRNCCF